MIGAPDNSHKMTPCIPCTPGEPLTANAAMLRRMLAVIEEEVLPKTEVEVAAGNKVFGAAILDGRGLTPPGRDGQLLPTVVADTNHETLCPMYHGEVYTIKVWSETLSPLDRPSPADSIFLSTHEPCCLCVSAIVWSGFKRLFFLFPYETTAAQGIPHDIKIMHELWQVPRYATCNKFLTSVGIIDAIKDCPNADDRLELQATVARITAKYDALSSKYHTEKTSNPKNTLAFG